MPLTAKERMANYRKRIRDDPIAHGQYKAKESERNERRRQCGQLKNVEDMSQREHRSAQKRWRNNNRKRQAKRKILNNMLTPPNSPDAVEIPAQVQQHNPVQIPQGSNRSTAMKKSIRKKKNKMKAACYRDNTKLKVKLVFQSRLTEKYKKRFNRLKKKLGKTEEDDDEKIPAGKFALKAYILHRVMVRNIRERYLKTKSNIEKRQISSLICGTELLQRYGLGSFTQRLLQISRRHMKPKSPRPPVMKYLRMKEQVLQFYERDDVSKMKPDKQATLTRNGVKKQVRLLSDDLKNLHSKYMSEGNQISYSMFCRLRPFFVVKPTDKDRQTCMCKIHDNISMKLKTANAAGMCMSKGVNEILKSVVCDENSKSCMYRECNICKDKVVEWDFGGDEGTQVKWTTWKNKRDKVTNEQGETLKVVSRTVKDTEQGTKRVLSDEINKELDRACRHIFNIRAQYKSLMYLRQKIKLTHEEIVMHIDFSENYNCKYSNEIQSMHFGPSRRQVSIHTGVAYLGEQIIPFCSVSDCLKHGPGAIWAHIQPVITYIKASQDKHIKGIHFISDGPTTQYRNKHNFYLWTKTIDENKFESSTWNFLEASHGKGAADGIGAAVKRRADNQVVVKDKDITCAKDMYDLLATDSKVKMFLVSSEDISAIENEIPQQIRPVPNTMKIHQLLLHAPRSFSSRVLSCFCQHPSYCDCFDPVTTEVCGLQSEISSIAETSEIRDPRPTSNSSRDDNVVQQAPISNLRGLRKPETLGQELIGQYIVVKYDNVPYPGVVLDVDEDAVEVKVMHKVGQNRYFWPRMEDSLWYGMDKIISIIEEPEQVTSRHCQINAEMWRLISKEL